MSLDRELIVRTALRLLDEVGLEKLSLRRLAKELGAHPTALYWHFSGKQELLDAM
ncbi:MAG: helix-turn-helix transcriptional regulator, partial [Nonomuraea sp.]|nr:helix-turn-helix transcriptional regulator [Nonomuraea sp.]